jgi:predicted Na+-dependent transporter
MELALVDVAALLFILSVGVTVGTAITFTQLEESLKQIKAIGIGFGAQFIFMPVMVWGLSHTLVLEDCAEVSPSALIFGASLVGCMPGGTTSNLFAWMVDGNVPLRCVTAPLGV